MKKIVVVSLVVLAALAIGLTFFPIEGKAQMGPGMMGGYGLQYQQPQRPIEEKDAKAILENYLRSTRNPNLKLGKIEDKGNFFEGEILTRNDALVDKILVDKYTGWTRSLY